MKCDFSVTVNGKPVCGRVDAVDLLLSELVRENARSDRHARRLRYQSSAAPASCMSTASR